MWLVVSCAVSLAHSLNRRPSVGTFLSKFGGGGEELCGAVDMGVCSQEEIPELKALIDEGVCAIALINWFSLFPDWNWLSFVEGCDLLFFNVILT